MDTIAKSARAVIRFENIPPDLRGLPNWALYTDKKAPIKISAVARGWPREGWNHKLEGADAQAGARINDPSTWGLMDDCYRYWCEAQERGDTMIVGPTLALQDELGMTVIDMDDPVAKIKEKCDPKTKLPISEEIRARLVEEALKNQESY